MTLTTHDKRMEKPNVLFFGATGYIGSTLLLLLGQDPDLKDRFHITALCRNSQKRLPELRRFYSDIDVVEGTLESDVILKEQLEKADILIHTAGTEIIKPILEGLQKSSAAKPGRPPIFIHCSGLGITSDNSRGEHVDIDDIPSYVDIDFRIDNVPQHNLHVAQDKLIIEAGTSKTNPIRTMIIYPGWVFGVGEAIQKTTMSTRIWVDMFLKLGYAGTWGEGYSRMGNIHVKDVGSAMITILKAALKGEADEGAEGLYFAVSRQEMITHREIATTLGNLLYHKRLVKMPGSRPFSDEAIDPLGEFGWTIYGANQIAYPHRLSGLGWKPTETKAKSFLVSLYNEVEVYLKETGRT